MSDGFTSKPLPRDFADFVRSAIVSCAATLAALLVVTAITLLILV